MQMFVIFTPENIQLLRLVLNITTLGAGVTIHNTFLSVHQ